jgi:hypothetical protein
MLILSFFLLALCAIAYVGELLEEQNSSPSPSRKLSEEEEMSIIWMLAKESPLESASTISPFED